MLHRGVILHVLCLVGWIFSTATQADDRPWLLVDTQTQTLSVIERGKVREEYKNISYGRGGVTRNRFRGDLKTPLGEFRVRWVNRNSAYHLFFGLDYPNLDYAERAYEQGRIDLATYYEIHLAFRQNRLPPQDTALGGFIGIHGLGRGNLNVHRRFHWTEGCIALTNEQIERLARWIEIGTRVVIR